MVYVNRISSFLYLWIPMVFLSNIYSMNESEINYNERKQTMTNPEQQSSTWLAYIQSTLKSEVGTYITKDNQNKSIILAWQMINPTSPQLSQKIQSVKNILVDGYTHMELEFARVHPEAIAQEMFLKQLAPLFSEGVEQVNWQKAQSQLKATFEQFFAATDFGMFAQPGEMQIFVTAKYQDTGKECGVIQCIITPEYAYGTVKAAFFLVDADKHGLGIEQLLMSTIFKLLPSVTRIFLHTRISNEQAIKLYSSWGFVQHAGPLPYWIDLEYRTENSDMLQKTAARR